jgi:hypothetical protein
LSEPRNYAALAESRGRTVLCAELPCSPDDRWWSLSDAELGQVVADDLARAGLPLARPPVGVLVRRLRHAYPIYLNGYESAFRTLDAWAESLPGLLTYGRQGLFAHDNTHHALLMAYRAADCLSGGRWDGARWREHRREFETHGRGLMASSERRSPEFLRRQRRDNRAAGGIVSPSTSLSYARASYYGIIGSATAVASLSRIADGDGAGSAFRRSRRSHGRTGRLMILGPLFATSWSACGLVMLGRWSSRSLKARSRPARPHAARGGCQLPDLPRPDSPAGGPGFAPRRDLMVLLVFCWSQSGARSRSRRSSLAAAPP